MGLLRALALTILSRSAPKPKPWVAAVVIRFPSAVAVRAQILVDGHDISHAVRALRINAQVGELIDISMDLFGHLIVEADAPAIANMISLDDLQREASADAPHAAGYPA